MKWKNKYNGILNEAGNLLALIKDRPDWEWAKSASPEIEQGAAALREAEGHQFVKELLAFDSNFLKQQYTEQQIITNTELLATFTAKQTKLADSIARMKRMHAASAAPKPTGALRRGKSGILA